jgi:hypothetical protein
MTHPELHASGSIDERHPALDLWIMTGHDASRRLNPAHHCHGHP